ncbi:MAG TPA: TIGR03032 family protein [Dongiaceae bacterium]|nr:TIGR03032 family protein [Dongiaceae bacterium]
MDTQAAGAVPPKFELFPSRQFPQWLAENNLSLAFTTYQAGKIIFVGLQPTGRLSIFERTFNRCMGLWSNGQSLWMSTLYQLWRFENVLGPGELHEGYDRVYVPQLAYTTGDIDIHDVALDSDGRPVFANTLFSCLATVSEGKSFRPLWRPTFISKLVPEDRCHLNGLAMRDGTPAYVTAVSESDVTDGWRDRRTGGGIVIDVRANEIVARGLTMPHSPRLHDGNLYLLDSGTGRFGRLDPGSGAFEEIAFCPGYLRGLAFHGNFAIVGLSQPRENKTFSGLPLDEALARRNADPICALMVIDLKTGAAVHWLKMEGILHELYDVVALPRIRRPQAIGLKTDEIRRILTIEE